MLRELNELNETASLMYEKYYLETESEIEKLRLAIAKGEDTDSLIQSVADTAWQNGFAVGAQEAGRAMMLANRKNYGETDE